MRTQCYFHQYEGDWATLQILLETSYKLPEYEEGLIQILGARSFYGNILPLADRLSRTLRLRREEQTRKAKRKTRCRGYSDKGTYVPEHERRLPKGTTVEEEVVKIDRRQQIFHPLLRDESYTPGRDPPPEHVSDALTKLRTQVQFRKELKKNGQSADTELEPAAGDGSTHTAEVETREQTPAHQESGRKEGAARDRDQGSTEIPEESNSAGP